MHHPIPLSILRDLKCRHCMKFVTCGPVHVVPDGSILCGRCRVLAKPNYRNYAYEAIGTLYYYPCYYWTKHCPYSLYWNESIEHERNCNYQSSCKLFWTKPATFFKSERKLPEGGDITFQPVSEESLESLKCVACQNYLSCSPVYIGSDGRNVCHRCTTSNGVPEGFIRNLSYEKLATIAIFPCIYRYRGCAIRLRYGRDMWEHEAECSYGQVYKKLSKKPSKDGKERGVIQTHSGHIWGTITPHSALFAPPKTKNDDGKIVTQELENVMRKKHKEEENKSADGQSLSSGDNNRISPPYTPIDNISRTSSRPPTREEDYSAASRELPDDSILDSYERIPRASLQNKSHSPDHRNSNDHSPNGYYQTNVAKYGGRSPALEKQYPHLFHFPPLYYDNNYNASNLNPRSSQNNPVKRNESLRDVIDELKTRQKKVNSNKKDESPYNLEDVQNVQEEVLMD